jgi:beta-glucosidase/6-phospho-beta-glucosidase/beta-galactosidase
LYWLSKCIRGYFALYAEACFANFGDRVKHWITINEPLQTSVNGYGIGIFAPGLCEGVAAEPFLAAHHQILAHASSVDVYRRKFKASSVSIYSTIIASVCFLYHCFSDDLHIIGCTRWPSRVCY